MRLTNKYMQFKIFLVIYSQADTDNHILKYAIFGRRKEHQNKITNNK